jgi:hypothetical protein
MVKYEIVDTDEAFLGFLAKVKEEKVIWENLGLWVLI